MGPNLDDRRTVAVFVIGAVAVTLVASVGFAALSENPGIPDASFQVRDAPQEFDLNRSGQVEMFVVEHTGGDPIPVGTLNLLLGTRSGGVRYNATADWRIEVGKFRYELLLNGDRITGGDTFAEGDRLTVTKMRGTAETASGSGSRFRVRLFHRPSRTKLVDERVRVR